ncbi:MULTISPECIES: HAD-IIB family hydrolase [Bacillus]|uniref:HAD-IIB family hydrolase n=1 Tax=Bacillus TaxID=1386 RepID=UPI001F59FEBF|nr:MULTISPECIES: HAD family hydrolase [Bacillus cereus group]USL15354.1 Cof-type HAD-IIB family hydrolase [Bacillus thuringiensis]
MKKETFTLKGFKFAAFDLDGTIVNERGEISQNIEKAILKLRKSGITPIIATGRVLQSYKNLFSSNRYNKLFHNKIVCHDGNILYEEGKITILKKIDLDFFWSIFYSLKSSADFVVINNGECFAETKSAALKYSMVYRINRSQIIVKSFDEINLNGLSNVYVFPKDKDKQISINYFSNYNVKPISYLNAFKITPNVNKADGLIKLLATDFHEKNLEKVIAFGDGENDVQMLNNCAIGIAVQNSHPAAINCSTYSINIPIEKFIEENLVEGTDSTEIRV